MKLTLLTKALLSALASTLMLLLVFLYTQGGFGGASVGALKQALLPGGLGEFTWTNRSDMAYVSNEVNNDSYYDNDHDQQGTAGQKNDKSLSDIPAYEPESSLAQGSGSRVKPGMTEKGQVLGDSVSSGHTQGSSSSSFPYNSTTPSTPSPLNFSALGITEYQLNSLIAQQLTNLASIGLLGNTQGSPSSSSVPSAPSLPAPVITYIQPAPSQNFAGASLLSATDLSSTRFTTATANITDTATIKTLSVTSTASIAGDLTVTGTITGNVSGTINPNLTTGSLLFQGPSGIAEDNANLFWDNTNKWLGVGTNVPGYQLDLSRIEGAVINSNAAQLNIAHYADAAYPYAGIQLDHHSNGLGNQGGTYISFINNGTPEALIQFDANLGVANSFSIQNSTANGPLLFKTNGDNERMRVTSAGNVGIGTTGPGSKLHVNGNIQQTAGYGGQVVISTSALNYTAPRFGSGVLINGTIGSSGDDEASVIIGGSSFGGDNSYFNTLVGPSANTAGNINGAVVIGAYASHRANNGSGVAVGRSSTTDAFSVALGYAATITGSASIALGNSSTVVGNNSASFGAGTVTGASLFSYGGSATKHGFGTVLPGSKVEIKGTGATFATSSLNVTNSSGTSMFFVRDDGNVGIGTATPAYKLDLGAGAVQAQIGSTLVGDWPALAGYAFIGNRALTQTASGNYALLQSSTGTTYINAATGQAINFAINNASPAMTVASTGNVGVGAGASGPGSKFAVAGGVTIGNDNAYYFGTAPTNGLLVQGNVGIGTTAPGKKFVINHNTVSTISFSDTNRPYWIYDYNNGGSVQWTSGYDIAGSNDFSIANIYSGTRDVFHIENAAPANAFRIIASSGNVGIGTTTPAYKLDVAGSISSDIGGGVGSYRAGGNRILYSDTVSTYVGNLDASKTLSLVAGTSTGATILANGNVGIGTTTPGNRLVVVPAANEVAAQFTTVSGADSGFYITPHAANDVVLGSGAAYASAVFTAKATSASVLNMYAGGYDFYGDTGLTVGSTYTPTMRMTIKPGGNVGIGTTSPDKLLTLYAATSNIRIGVTDRAISFSRSSDGSYVASITNADLGGNLTFDSRNAHTFTADTFQAMKVYEDATAAKGKVLVGAGNIAPGYSYLAVNGNASFGSGYYTTAAPTDGLIVQGNVGIGTTSPTQKLYVNTGAATIDIRASSVGQGGLNIVGDGPTSYAPSIKLYNASTLVGALGASMGGEYSSSAGTNDVVLRSDVAKLMLQSGTGAAALTINTSNNVGIGTTNPGEKFHLVGNFKMNGVIFNSDTGTGFDVGGNQWKGFAGGQTIYDSQAAKILARFSNGSVLSTGDSTVAANASLIIPKLWADQISATDGGGGTAGRSFTVKAGDSSTQPQYGGGNGGNLLLQGGKATDNSLGNGGAAGYVAINTYAFGASSPTERMRIASDGNVGIGTTSPAQKLDVAGYVRAYSSSANVGVSLSYTGASGREYQLLSCAGCNSGGAGTLEVFDSTAGAARAYIASGVNGWQTPSDRRLKTNIETLTVLDKLSALRGTSYTLLDSGKQQIGVIAQELQQAFPFAVSGTESSTTYLGVSYDAVATIALQGVKELNDKLAALQVSIASLQGTGTHFGSATPIVLQAHLYLSSDSVGQAKVLAGATRVRIIFDRPYEFQPVVTVTPLDFVDAAYRVTSMDSTGFTIELRLAAQADVTFNWHAFASPEAKLTVSDGTTQQLMLAIPPSPTNGQASLAPTVSENEVTGSVDDTTQSNAEPQSEVVGESVDVSTQPEAATPLSEEMPTESGSGAAEE